MIWKMILLMNRLLFIKLKDRKLICFFTKHFFRRRLNNYVELFEDFMIDKACRICGCTDYDCQQCINKTGVLCHRVEDDLCKACAEELDIND